MVRNNYESKLPESALTYILEGLLPYTTANLKLAFKPNLFFNDLEKISRKKHQTLRNAYYKAQKQGLIELDHEGIPQLTSKGRRHIVPYAPKHQPKGACLMVAFDIPEAERWKRRHLRLLLKELSFTKVQQSLWISHYDHREYLTAEIKQHGLEKFVVVYEATKLRIT
jgi:DNA-binding transcriptional regulator PaaX